MNSSTIECGSETAFCSPTVFRTGNEKLNVSGRLRPRLVKVRRQLGSQQGKLGCTPNNIDTGFNPFLAVSESSDQGNDSEGMSNEFSNFNGDVTSVKFENVGFVFGANRSDSDVSFGSQKIDPCERAKGTGYVDRVGMKVYSGKLDQANGSDCAVNLNAESRGFSENVGKFACNDRAKIKIEGLVGHGNHGNVSGANGTDSALKSNSEKREFGGTEGNWGLDDGVKVTIKSGKEAENLINLGFIYGANENASAPILNVEKRESSGNVGNLVSDNSVDFNFGTNLRKPVENLKMEAINFYNNMRQSASDDRSQVKVEVRAEHWKFDNMGFVFGSSGRNSVSNVKPKKVNSTKKNVGKSNSDNWGKMKIGIKEEFCADRSASISNSNMGKRECFERSGSSVFDDKEKTKVQTESDYQRLMAAAVGTATSLLNKSGENVVFASVSSSSESCSFTGGRVPKNNENFGKFDCIANTQNSNFGLDANNWHTSECCSSGCGSGSSIASGCGKSSSIASARGNNPVFELSDQIRKLSIHSFANVGDAYKNESFKLSSCSQSDDVFVFSSKGSSSCVVSSSVSHSQIKNSNLEVPGNGIAVDKNDEIHLKTSDKDIFKRVSSENNFGSIDGCTENMVPNVVISGSSDSNVQTNLGCSFEFLGKERQPINLDDKRLSDPPDGCTSPAYTFQAGLAKRSDVTQCSQGQVNDGAKVNGAAKQPSFSSFCVGFLPNGGAFEASLASESERKDSLSFTSTPNGLGVHSTNPQTPKSEALFSSTANFCPGLNEKPVFSAKSRSIKHRNLKKEKGKLRQPIFAKGYPGKDFSPVESSFLGSPNARGCYSPMDFSPYQETVTDAQCAREASATSNKPYDLHVDCAPSVAHSTGSTDAQDEDLIATRESETKGQESLCKGQFECERQIEPESACHKSATEPVCFSSGVAVASAESVAGCHSNAEDQESTCKGQFFFASNSEDLTVRKFTFSASSPAQGCPSAAKHQYTKKNRLKGSHHSASINLGTNSKFESSSVQVSALGSNSSLLNKAVFPKGDQFSKGDIKFDADEVQLKQQACEKWRFRGNQAYKNGKFSKAEDYYTKGVNSVPPDEASGCCLEPLVMCYSNRAAARMSLGRIRDALEDCKMAVALDPDFLKAHIRAANCHLVLGEADEALQYCSKCVESRSDVCLDRRIIIEAFEGKQRAQKVIECTKHSTELLQKGTSDAAANALGVIAEALSISSYSERLLEMKAEALYMLREYEEVIHLCKQTIVFAEKNFDSLDLNNEFESLEIPECKSSLFFNLWRSRFICKSYFNMGKLEVVLNLLVNQEKAGSVTDKFWNKKLDSSTQLAATIRALLHHKNAGNEAFQAGRYIGAVEHYTAALTTNVESLPFAAILFCNRGAAHQALGQFADAIADCSLAIALDETYQKAISRRAALHEKIRDHGQAASDLRRLMSVLEKQSPESLGVKDISQAQRRLSTMEEEAKKGISLDLYLILGVRSSDTASEIKKAFRKAALRHHPDKAGQFLARNGSGGDDGRLWKEIVEEIHRDADRLFKMIGEAYAVLSDPTKRSQYDREEKIRNASRDSDGSSIFAQSSDTYDYPYESRMNRGNWRGTYKTYGNSHSRW